MKIQAMELCSKETEETIRAADESFLQEQIAYLRTHLPEFLYVESPAFEELTADSSLVLEVDDLFGTYMALFGLHGKKKDSELIQSFIEEQLQRELTALSIAFSEREGLWELNLPLNALDGFSEELTIKDVLVLLRNVLEELQNQLKAGH